MERKKPVCGIVGILLGSIALLLSLTHFWAGPFSPQPTIETVVAEKAASIRSAALSALRGEEPIQEYQTSNWNIDQAADVVTAVFGGLAFILGIVGFSRHEPKRVVGGAAALGISAVAFQFIAMYAMALLVVLLIAAVLSGIGVG
ncbi:hypothetical protein GCM10011352_34960 [Marinobacterium zhoushanense]|uniref:Inner membrane protein yidI n=1 Tax=Marinobacterium zhoushanense TaxID=1679163 RepID=A0ABQ1KUB9_9GAMM|nr:hypothetical protein [Marinobacterium zhoushanense]GGC05773.1 hypothetical protein GCM10011352_34960 [Marinobacterium zhoushanense]